MESKEQHALSHLQNLDPFSHGIGGRKIIGGSEGGAWQINLGRLKAIAPADSCLIQCLATPLQSGACQGAKSHLWLPHYSWVTLGKSRLLPKHLFAHL